MAFIPRFFQKISNNHFLFGPRGTGKSSWLKNEYPKAVLIDLLKDEMFRKLSAHPDSLEEFIDKKAEFQTLIIDEVQKIPALLGVVHFLIETYPNVQFILTGSSARKLKRSGIDLLAGRAWLKNFHPFMGSELKNAFNIEAALQFGMLPVVLSSTNPKEVLKAYIGLYLKEEVVAESLVRNIGSFSRFLEALSFSQGCVLNISNIARDCSVNRKTAEGYVEIIQDLLIGHKLHVFQKKSKRRLALQPKFYFFDTGVFRSLRPSGPLDEPEMIHGQVLEGLVYQHLYAWTNYHKEDYSIYFWRTKDGTEVDFIIYGPKGFWAIEVKNTNQIRLKDLRSLKSFKKDFPQCTALFLYRGNLKLERNGIHCIPCEDFLLKLHPNSPIF